jgi:hypothetical protein
VAGRAARLVPPGDVGALAESIGTVLDNPALQSELVEAGPAQARRFCWETAGRLTARTYARALGLPAMPQERTAE